MRWAEFTAACPELAEMAQRRFVRDQLVLVGTLRTDGWPRISPCEVDIAAGHLFLGMMWRSTKALDLLRDSRLIV
ncbi:MAG: pyridoxamine 5'-phosphate oxidase family protein, partial [Terriglobia bacterium]